MLPVFCDIDATNRRTCFINNADLPKRHDAGLKRKEEYEEKENNSAGEPRSPALKPFRSLSEPRQCRSTVDLKSRSQRVAVRSQRLAKEPLACIRLKFDHYSELPRLKAAGLAVRWCQ